MKAWVWSKQSLDVWGVSAATVSGGGSEWRGGEGPGGVGVVWRQRLRTAVFVEC